MFLPQTYFIWEALLRKGPKHMLMVPSGPHQGLLSVSEPVQQDPAPSQLALTKFYPSDRTTYKVQRTGHDFKAI